MPAEVATANDVTFPLLAATRDRPDILPVYVSLTSGEPPPETKAVLDEHGDGAPLLRGAAEAFTAIAHVARWEGRQRSPRWPTGRGAPTWPAMAAERSTVRDAPTTRRRRQRRAPAPVPRRVLSERESLDLLRAAGLRGDARPSPCPMPTPPSRPPGRSAATPSPSSSTRAGLAHKSDLGLVALGLVGDERGPRRGRRTCWPAGRRHGLDIRGLLVEPMADPGVELIVGMRRDPSFGPAVHGRARRRPDRGPRRRRHPASRR